MSTYKLWLLSMQVWHGLQAPLWCLPTACRGWLAFAECFMQLGVPVQQARWSFGTGSLSCLCLSKVSDYIRVLTRESDLQVGLPCPEII